MRRYLVLTPPGGPDREHSATRVLPDGFSWTALLFPAIWLIWHRLWLSGIAAFLLQVTGMTLLGTPSLAPGGALLLIAVSLLVALEGRNHYARSLIRRGWNEEAVISAINLDSAEEIYFSSLPQPEALPLPASRDWSKTQQPVASDRQGPVLGLFEYGGR